MADTLAWKIPWTEETCRLLSIGSQSQTELSDFLFSFYLNALEKEMATYTRAFAWRIPGTREPGGLPSVRSHRVWHNWSNLAAAAAYMKNQASLVAQSSKECACNVGDLVSIPGWGRSPGEGKGYWFQYSGLENYMDCTIHGVAKSQTRLSDFHYHNYTWKSRNWCSHYWKQ